LHIYHLTGITREVERILEEMIETKKPSNRLRHTMHRYGGRVPGKLDLAFEFLDKAYEERDILMTAIRNQAGGYFSSLTPDPRFRSLLARMKLDF
jgi:hypothetical protein